MKTLPKRVASSPLVKFVNFEDGSFVNLIKLNKPYADGRSYFVHETTSSVFCSSEYLNTYDQALIKFNLMVENGAKMSPISTGVTL